MRADLWSRVATIGWVVSIVGCHTPGTELESVRYGPTEDRFGSDTYTVANINITYEDEHGELYTETSEVRKYIYCFYIKAKNSKKMGLRQNVKLQWLTNRNLKKNI